MKVDRFLKKISKLYFSLNFLHISSLNFENTAAMKIEKRVLLSPLHNLVIVDYLLIISLIPEKRGQDNDYLPFITWSW
jgi:hypothetical protein